MPARRWGTVGEELARFRQDLPKVLAMCAALGAGGLVWRLVAGDGLAAAAALGGALFVGAALIAPAWWIKHWRRTPQPDELRRWLPVFGLVLAWCVVALALMAAVLAAAGALGPR